MEQKNEIDKLILLMRRAFLMRTHQLLCGEAYGKEKTRSKNVLSVTDNSDVTTYYFGTFNMPTSYQ